MSLITSARAFVKLAGVWAAGDQLAHRSDWEWTTSEERSSDRSALCQGPQGTSSQPREPRKDIIIGLVFHIIRNTIFNQIILGVADKFIKRKL